MNFSYGVDSFFFLIIFFFFFFYVLFIENVGKTL